MITLRPDGGICNRLRAIGSAMRLAREYNTDLQVEWFRCPLKRWAGMCGMRVAFSDLFEPIVNVKVVEKIKIRNDFPWNAHRYSARNPGFYFNSMRQQFVEDFKRSPKTNYWLSSGIGFYENTDFSWVIPKAAIKKKIAAKAESFGSRCVGVHIRRSDNAPAIAGSPLRLFELKIEEEISKDADVRFFLSTDDEPTKRLLVGKYGSRILYCENVGMRYTTQGEVDALIDLFLLSKTRKIYGSYWSSFSEVASMIGGIGLEVLVDKSVSLPEWATR